MIIVCVCFRESRLDYYVRITVRQLAKTLLDYRDHGVFVNHILNFWQDEVNLLCLCDDTADGVGPE